MPSISVNSVNLTASTRTANIIAGDPNEFLNYPARVTVYQISSATGIRSSVMADTDVVVDDKEILPIGTSLLVPDHQFTQFDVEAGTRLSIFLRETAAAGTTDVLTLVEIEPLE
jgi:3D (Asp-Asp-Asp) domain-containing protein